MHAQMTARIVEWYPERGYVYLNTRNGRLFLHIQDFSARHKKPEVGDVILFSVGQDKKGRTCAVSARHAYEGGKVSILNLLLLLALMFLPALASFKFGLSPWLIAGYLLISCFVTFMAFALDKARAREGKSRVSESMLHFFEMAGGWPGAYLAQRRLRHKCLKGRYQMTFWLIVISYQFLAIDYLHEWPLTSAALERVFTLVDGLPG